MSHWSCTDVYSTRTSVNERLCKYVPTTDYDCMHLAFCTYREGERERERQRETQREKVRQIISSV